MGTISLPRHDATISASKERSQRPCSISKITKSSPHAASMCPMPGVKVQAPSGPREHRPVGAAAETCSSRHALCCKRSLVLRKVLEKAGPAQHLVVDHMLRPI